MNSKVRAALCGKVVFRIKVLSPLTRRGVGGLSSAFQKTFHIFLLQRSCKWPGWPWRHFFYYVTKLLAISGQLLHFLFVRPCHRLKSRRFTFPPSTHLVCLFDPTHFLSYPFKEPNITATTNEDEVLTFHRIDVSSGLRCHACQQLVWQSRSVQFSYGMLLPLSSLALVLILWHI